MQDPDLAAAGQHGRGGVRSGHLEHQFEYEDVWMVSKYEKTRDLDDLGGRTVRGPGGRDAARRRDAAVALAVAQLAAVQAARVHLRVVPEHRVEPAGADARHLRTFRWFVELMDVVVLIFSSPSYRFQS